MVATNETVELALVGARLSQIIIVTHHFRQMEVGLERTLQDLIDSWQVSCQAPFLAAVTSDYTLTKIVARHVCGSLPLDATTEEAIGSTGTRPAPANPTPPWFAQVVRERTGNSGRSYRGRFFMPVCDESDFDRDTITPGVVAVVQAYATALGARFLAGGADAAHWRLVVHSRKLAAVPGTQCQVSSTLVDTLAVQSALTTQRSRRMRPA